MCCRIDTIDYSGIHYITKLPHLATDNPQPIKLGGGFEMKTIAEEPVTHTGSGECCCYKNSSNGPCTIGYHHCVPPVGEGTCYGATNGGNTQAIPVPGNKVLVTVSSTLHPTGDSISPIKCSECTTATITARKKLSSNLNDNSRRQRYVMCMKMVQGTNTF